MVVGLGNPGKSYSKQRHNLGFMLIDHCLINPSWRSRFNAQFAQIDHSNWPHYWLKPQTFMNLSGQSVAAACKKLNLRPEQILVLHDELDLPTGVIRLKYDGGAGGHNGLKSIIADLGAANFWRLRLGIGKPGPDFAGDTADYVLSRLPQDAADLLLEKGSATLDAIFTHGCDKAMQNINR